MTLYISLPQELLAKMGVPLQQCRQSYQYMTPALRSHFATQMNDESVLQLYNLVNLVDGVTLARDSNNPPNVGSWGGPFPSGALICMADGAVRVFPYNTPNFSLFLTPRGGEVALGPD